MIGCTEAELRWLACALDGEGCISIGSGHPQPHARMGWHFQVVVGIANSSESFMREAMRIARRGRLWRESGKKDGYKPVFKWQTYGLKAKELLTELVPYLFAKQQQALLAIDFPRLDGVRGRPSGTFLRLVQIAGWGRMRELNACGNSRIVRLRGWGGIDA